MHQGPQLKQRNINISRRIFLGGKIGLKHTAVLARSCLLKLLQNLLILFVAHLRFSRDFLEGFFAFAYTNKYFDI